MGNCLVLQENMVRIMKNDGKILEYKTPIKVEEVLVEFSGHAVSESQQVLKQLHPNTKLLSSQLYHLVPLPPPPPSPSPKAPKKVRFANPEVQQDVEKSSKVVRIKLVISKQKLQDMMMQNGGISVDKMLSLVHGEKGMGGEDLYQNSDDIFLGCNKGELVTFSKIISTVLHFQTDIYK